MTTQPSTDQTPEEQPGGLSRRTVLRGAAYAVPAVTLLSMTTGTAEAASVPPSGVSPEKKTQPIPPTVRPAGTAHNAAAAGVSNNVASSAAELPFTGTQVTTVAAVAGAALAVGTAATIAGKKRAED
ncbi:MAG: hypothetical protein JWL64_1285 [Frankiales bacterium]|nr:hypothetical protein [Frankiales bacterium]